MATNRDLLKEAIADAKAVKETAIANAKAALTESFTPFLREKLSEKIQAMDDEDDTYMDEMVYNEVEENEGLDEISLDELLAELEENDSEMEENLYEAKEEKEEDEEMSIEDMSEDDLKSFIEDVIKDMVANKELEAGHEGMEDEEGAEEMEEPADKEGDDMEDEEKEVDIEELLAEIEEGESEEVEALNEFSFDISTADAIISMLAPVGVITGAALVNFRKEIKDWFKKNNKTEISDAELTTIIKAKEAEVKTGKVEENTQIAELKSELNEINLLNAKLLYTNKIFRSKSLSESQKIKVLTAFDKAKNKKEAQLVYETLLESLKVSNIGAKTSIKESLGSASKSLGNAKAKPIIEVDNQFARWQTLAGIKK